MTTARISRMRLLAIASMATLVSMGPIGGHSNGSAAAQVRIPLGFSTSVAVVYFTNFGFEPGGVNTLRPERGTFRFRNSSQYEDLQLTITHFDANGTKTRIVKKSLGLGEDVPTDFFEWTAGERFVFKVRRKSDSYLWKTTYKIVAQT